MLDIKHIFVTNTLHVSILSLLPLLFLLFLFFISYIDSLSSVFLISLQRGKHDFMFPSPEDADL